MEFTYQAYTNLLNAIRNRGYSFTDYHNYREVTRPVIMRHDIDNSLEKALSLARIEHAHGVSSTYFVLLSTDFYNVFSKESNQILQAIMGLGHEVGLHFDEKRYDVSNLEDLYQHVAHEADILGRALGTEIRSLSMHRPSKWILENDMEFEGLVNSYSKAFLKDFKYVSDSRMNWREDVMKIVNEGAFEKLHILTHAFWYAEKSETMSDKILELINHAPVERYRSMKDNISDIGQIIPKECIDLYEY